MTPPRLMPLPLAALIATLAAQGALADTSTAVAANAGSTAVIAPEATVEAVTVTARRRLEQAQDVPAPISTLKGSTLEQQHLYQVQDLQQLLPNTNAAFIHARQSSLAVRGLGNNPANEGLEGSVGVVLDNVFLGRPGMAVFDLLDIDQLELLRGPQGTLFGKNTTAGVLNISSKAPSFTPSASVDASYGSRNTQQYHARATGAVSDSTAVSAAVYKTRDDGWLSNQNDGQKLNAIDRSGARAQVLWVPHDDFSLRVIADYNQEDSTTGTMQVYGQGPVAPGKKPWAVAAAAAGATGLATDFNNADVNIDGVQQAVVHQGGLSAEATWNLRGYTLTSITAWRKWDFRPHNDVDFSNAPGMLDAGFDVDDQQVSQELRLASPSGGPVDYVTGAYYFHQRASNVNFSDYGSQADTFLGTPNGLFNNVSTRSYGLAETDSYALFGQATWHATQTLDLTAGVRITTEDKSARVYRVAPVGGAQVKALVAARNLPAYAGAWDSGDLSDRSTAPSGLLSAAWHLTPDVLAYATVAHGEKSGGYNINGVAGGPNLGADSLRVDPEKADDGELGIKSEWLQHRLLLNANLYLTRVTGYQTNTYLTNPVTGLPVAAMTNAGDVRSKGIEFDIKAVPLPAWQIGLNGSYNSATYGSFTRAPCSAEQQATGATVCDLSGQPLNGAPRWILNLGSSYEWGVGAGLRQYASANYGWRSGSYGDLSDSQYSWIPAYGLANIATGLKGKLGNGDQWEASLWVKNLFDKRYALTVNTAPLAGGLYTASVGAPRTLGGTLLYAFK
ncbi:TonB-dependent receptor [Amantichitinum ursilacus]|uniref:Pesticin receptor n=1 Tax=Amantichitinum ursilacus TaxID=857265 RepID=A0A0N0GQZ9_9NEIS|nr:TonB-dependent receptor [Amantichitinum ursilacus]KPC55009.1 Pesticin receptor precursor [Amantichitinum ursilacus]